MAPLTTIGNSNHPQHHGNFLRTREKPEHLINHIVSPLQHHSKYTKTSLKYLQHLKNLIL